MATRADLLWGTLILLILETLGPVHGLSISRRLWRYAGEAGHL